MNVNLFLRLVVNLLIVRISLEYLGAEQYGLWIILQSTVMYLSLSEIGLGQTVLNFTSAAYANGSKHKVNQILSTSFGLYWLIIIPFWLILTAVILTQPVDIWLLGHTSKGLSHIFTSSLLIFGTLSLIRIPFSVSPATLSGLREIPLRQVYEAIIPIFMLFGTWSVLKLGGGLLGLILTIGIGLLLIVFVSYFLLKYRHPWVQLSSIHWVPSQLKHLLTNSSFFFLTNLSLVAQRSAGNFLAARFGTLEQVPQMFALLTIFRIIGWTLADSISKALQPYMIKFEVEGNHDRVLFFAGLSTKITFSFSLIFISFSCLIAEHGMQLWLGSGMFLGNTPLLLLAATFLIDVLFLPGFNFIIALNRHKMQSIAVVFHVFLTFISGIAGAKLASNDPFIGMTVGFLVASFLGQLTIMPFIHIHELQISRQRYLKEFLLRPLILCVGVWGILLFPFLENFSTFWIRSFFAMIVSLFVTMAGWKFILNGNERQWLKHISFMELRKSRRF